MNIFLISPTLNRSIWQTGVSTNIIISSWADSTSSYSEPSSATDCSWDSKQTVLFTLALLNIRHRIFILKCLHQANVTSNIPVVDWLNVIDWEPRFSRHSSKGSKQTILFTLHCSVPLYGSCRIFIQKFLRKTNVTSMNKYLYISIVDWLNVADWEPSLVQLQ